MGLPTGHTYFSHSSNPGLASPWEFPQTTPASATISSTLPRQPRKIALSLNLPQLQPQMAHHSGADEAGSRTFHSWYLL